uniref:Peptidylprolyl isomerase n=1 Tax=Auxenochlorella protothecoides TaxID=3075 RepID=A0A1D2A8I5_AUXPR
MGKKRAAKDRAYLTATEWKEEWGGHKAGPRGVPFKSLPFHCCAISFQPFEDAVCTADGTVFDIVHAVPYIQKFHKHPVTGEPLELKDLIRLHWHKNTDGEYACPTLGKVFTPHTHIVAIRTSGNVYCHEAVQELNLKTKNLRDLLTDEPFTRKDIIQIQDPLNLSGKNLAEFDHVKKELTVESAEERAAREAQPMNGIRAVDEDTQRVLSSLNTKEAELVFEAGGGGRKAEAERLLAKALQAATGKGDASNTAVPTQPGGTDPRLRSAPRAELNVSFRPGASTWNTDEPAPSAPSTSGQAGQAPAFDASAGRPLPKPYSAKFVVGHSTTGAASRAFTSTAMTPVTRNERTMELIELKPTKKGYMRLHTSLGDLNLELHADLAPKTCENFFALLEGGYYTGTAFHRSIKNFMIQGGDPTGTGKGGESVFGGKFKDELTSALLHSGRGVLSMANSGPGTNGSQFFILYKSAHHLDYKHTVFGRVVGGFETLTLMEKVPVDDEDRPLQPITITGASVFVNPYKELLEEEAKAAAAKSATEAKEAARETESAAPIQPFFALPSADDGEGGVGKYLTAPAGPARGGGTAAPKKQKTGGGFANFDGW